MAGAFAKLEDDTDKKGDAATALAVASPAPATAPAAMAGPRVRPWTPAKAALYLLVAAFIVSEYYFYLFTQPVTESEARNFLGLGQAAAFYLSNVLAADDSVTCSLVGANVDGTLARIEQFSRQYKGAGAKQRRAIIAMGALLVIGWFIGSCSVLVGLKPKTAQEWSFGAFLVSAQMALYFCSGIANAVIAVHLLQEAFKRTPRAAVADETTSLLSATAASTEDTAGRADPASRFSELRYQTVDGNEAVIPTLHSRYNSFYLNLELARTLVGLAIRGATFAFTGQKAMELLTDNPTATAVGAIVGGVTGATVQALTITPMGIEAAMRKARLAQMTLPQLTAFKGSIAADDEHPEITALRGLAASVIADKQAGILRTAASSVLPMVLWDNKSPIAGGIVLFFAVGALINRFFDNSGFTVNFLGNGIAQRFPIALIALLAAAQWFTTNFVIGRGALIAVKNDVVALTTAVGESACCRRKGSAALSGLGGDTGIGATAPAMPVAATAAPAR